MNAAWPASIRAYGRSLKTSSSPNEDFATATPSTTRRLCQASLPRRSKRWSGAACCEWTSARACAGSSSPMTCWPAVKESRDSRRAREAEEAARARERAAREQQRRNRRNAALVGAGAFVVIVLAGLAGWSTWKAAKLLQEAEITRLMANADRL